MYKCKHFEIHELVPKHIYESRGERAWELLDERALFTLDLLRDRFGPITVNNYAFGGSRQWSGLRTAQSPYYSETSQHSFGRAFDCLFRDSKAEAVRRHILSDPGDYNITGIELNVAWLHFDCRNSFKIKTFTS